jgi:flagellar biosynthesis protein FlhF
MELKTYQAKSMSEALAKVKADLGSDAVIMHTRSIRRGGVLGVGGRTIVEITATTDERVPQIQATLKTSEAPPVKRVEKIPDAVSNAEEIRVEVARIQDLENSIACTEAAVEAEVAEIRSMLDGLIKDTRSVAAPQVPAELLEFHTKLISQHVAEEIVREILARVKTDAQGGGLSARAGATGKAASDLVRKKIESELLRCIAEMLPPAEPLKIVTGRRPAVIALVGPTGVGKTTTIAKLAANLKIREGRKVGLITIDTYRIAAVEQLKIYAQIMKIPVVSALTPADIHTALDQMSSMDVILIDTAGRSQRDDQRIAELAEFMNAAAPQQVHLVLSSTSGEQTIREAIEKFAPVGAKHVIFTKLDEAVGFGVLLNVLRTAGVRLSYLTTGQSVPDDIEPGAAQRVAQLILNGQVGSKSRNGVKT